MNRALLLATILSFLLISLASSQSTQPSSAPPPSASCIELPPSTLCSHILPYASTNVSLVPSTSTTPTCSISRADAQIDTRAWNAASQPCRLAIASITCLATFPPCGALNNFPPADACSSLKLACSSSSDKAIASLSGADAITCEASSSSSSSSSSSIPPPSSSNSSSFDPSTLLAPRCELYTGTICSQIIDRPIFVSPPYSQNDLESQLQFIYGAFAVATVVNRGREAFFQAMCWSAFPPCSTTVLKNLPQEYNISTTVRNLPIPFPLLPQRSICDSAALLAPYATAAIALDCNNNVTVFDPCSVSLLGSPPIFFSTPSYPQPGFAALLTAPILISTFTPPPLNLSVSVSVTCPFPTVIPDRPSEGIMGGSCGVPCLSVMFTYDEWKQAYLLVAILAPSSLVFMLYYLVTWTLFFPSIRFATAWWLSLTLVLMHGLIMTTAYPTTPGQFTCSDNVTPIPGTGYCRFQSGAFQFLVVSTTTWAAMLSFDAFHIVILGSGLWKLRSRRLLIGIQHGIVWGLSFSALIAQQSTGNYGPDTVVPWCWNPFNSNSTWLLLSIVNLNIVACVVFVSTVVLRLFFSRKKLTSPNAEKQSNWKLYTKLLVFEYSYAGLVSYGLYCLYLSMLKGDQWTNDLTNWVTCVMNNAWFPSSCVKPTTFSLPELRALMLCMASYGVVFFFSYFSRSYVVCWQKAFRSAVFSRSSMSSLHMKSNPQTNSRARGLASRSRGIPTHAGLNAGNDKEKQQDKDNINNNANIPSTPGSGRSSIRGLPRTTGTGATPINSPRISSTFDAADNTSNHTNNNNNMNHSPTIAVAAPLALSCGVMPVADFQSEEFELTSLVAPSDALPILSVSPSTTQRELQQGATTPRNNHE